MRSYKLFIPLIIILIISSQLVFAENNGLKNKEAALNAILQLLLLDEDRDTSHSCPIPPGDPFCHDWYLDNYPDVQADSRFASRPCEHYVLYGKKEGRQPCPPDVGGTPGWPYDYTVPPGVVFWHDWYLSQNSDVRTHWWFWCRPYEHYVTAGKGEGRRPLPSSNGLFTEIATIDDYLWFMASKNQYLYSGAYRLSAAGSTNGNDNYYYRLNLNNGIVDSFKKASLDESTRVYNMGGQIYTTTEGGVVWKNGVAIGNLGSHFVLGGEHHNNANLISKALQPAKTEIFDCTDTRCTKINTLNGVFGFHMIPTTGPSIQSVPVRMVIATKGRGFTKDLNRSTVGVIKQRFGAYRLVENSTWSLYDAEILSYNGTWRIEKIFHGMDHFGDFTVWKNRLYAVVVKDGGSPEVWFENSGGNWQLKLSQTQLSKYGVSGDLVNAAGFFTVTEDNRLFMNINTSHAGRNGPGYILEIN